MCDGLFTQHMNTILFVYISTRIIIFNIKLKFVVKMGDLIQLIVDRQKYNIIFLLKQSIITN